MLIILYGTSCSGKSEIIKELVTNNGFKIIMCYHTRKKRKNDLARTRVSEEIFDKWVLEGKLGFVNEQLNARYGNKIKSFEIAVDSIEKYVLDWPLSKRDKLKIFPHKKIIIIPESKEQLIFQIEKAKRQDRKKEIIKDYETNYNNKELQVLKNNDFKIIINKKNNLSFAVKEILKLVK